jgi:hypothetical protein
VELNLTPGVSIVDQVLAVIDVDGDGSISPEEAQRYASAVAANLSLKAGALPVDLKLTGKRFPDPREFREGAGTISLRFTADLPPMGQGRDLRFENRHAPAPSVYLANALTPPPGVSIVGQVRDPLQTQLIVSYAPGEAPGSPRMWILAALFVLAVGVRVVRPAATRA